MEGLEELFSFEDVETPFCGGFYALGGRVVFEDYAVFYGAGYFVFGEGAGEAEVGFRLFDGGGGGRGGAGAVVAVYAPFVAGFC